TTRPTSPCRTSTRCAAPSPLPRCRASSPPSSGCSSCFSRRASIRGRNRLLRLPGLFFLLLLLLLLLLLFRRHRKSKSRSRSKSRKGPTCIRPVRRPKDKRHERRLSRPEPPPGIADRDGPRRPGSVHLLPPVRGLHRPARKERTPAQAVRPDADPNARHAPG